jgi:hypothetical protein
MRLLAIAAALGMLGCSSSSSSPPADAGPDSCAPEPVVKCDASPKGSDTCTGDPKAAGPEKDLPADQSFAVGCRAYFYTDVCQVRFGCTCALSGTAAKWSCL